MKRHLLTRRAFLKGAGGMTLALPLLHSLNARASTGQFPQRLVVVFNPNGVIHEDVVANVARPGWFPVNFQDETTWDLGPVHQVLAPYKNRLNFFNGMDLSVTALGVGEPHQRGMGGILTGMPINMGPFVGGTGETAGWAQGMSFDQRIANVVGADTRLRSLQLGVRTNNNVAEVRNRINYAGNNDPIPPVDDPRQVFNSVFGQPADNTQAARLRAQRTSVLDAVQAQFASLNARLPAVDRQKLDAHVTLVRDLEMRLTSSTNMGTCVAPARPADMVADDEDTMETVTNNQTDLLAAAFACDLTRVATLQFSNAINPIRFPWLNSLEEGHGLSHQGSGSPTARSQLMARDTWYATQIKLLMDKLAAIPEGSGSVLDNTVILWCNELSIGSIHSNARMPFMLAGNAGGALATGKYFQLTNMPHNNLLLSLINAFGLPDTSFGHATYCTGQVPGLNLA